MHKKRQGTNSIIIQFDFRLKSLLFIALAFVNARAYPRATFGCHHVAKDRGIKVNAKKVSF